MEPSWDGDLQGDGSGDDSADLNSSVTFFGDRDCSEPESVDTEEVLPAEKVL